MYSNKIYTFILIAILNLTFVYGKEDLSVYVKLKDYNITNASQLIPTDPKYMHDIDKGYYLLVTVSLVNNTNKIKKIELGATCAGYNPWKIEGDLHFVAREIHCRKNLASHYVTLKPKKSYNRKFRLFFPISYLNRKVHFKIGFTETLYLRSDKLSYHKPIATYWSKRIVINENAEAAKLIVKNRPSHTKIGRGEVTIIKENILMKDIPLNVRELMKKDGAQNTGL